MTMEQVQHVQPRLSWRFGVLPQTITPGAAILLAAVIASGVAAARASAPILWLVTPIVAMLILHGALRRRPSALRDDFDASAFPSALRRTLQWAASELPNGESRALLVAVVARARAIFVGDRVAAFDNQGRVRRDVADLTAAACETAVDLARLDIFLGPHRALAGERITRHPELDARYRAARELFVRRLVDAEIALRSLYTADVERGTPASDRVAELVTEINAESAARRAAGDELRRLLGSRGAIS